MNLSLRYDVILTRFYSRPLSPPKLEMEVYKRKHRLSL